MQRISQLVTILHRQSNRVASIFDDHTYTLNTPRGPNSNLKCLRISELRRDNKLLWSYYQCNLCPYKSKSHDVMRIHLKRHSATKYLKTFDCSTSVVERYKCGSCSYKNGLLVNFSKHKKGNHQRGSVHTVDNMTTFQKTYCCDRCSFKCFSQLLYIRHYTKCPVRDFLQKQKENTDGKEKSEKQKKFSCPSCPYVTKRSFFLDRHIKENHEKNDIKLVKCPYCTYTSPQRRFILRHLRVHCVNDEKDCYHCQYCPFETMSPQDMHFHLMAHVENRKKKGYTSAREYKRKNPKIVSSSEINTSGSSNENVGPSPQLSKKKKRHLLDYVLPADPVVPQDEEDSLDWFDSSLVPQPPRNSVTWYQCDKMDYKTKNHRELEDHIFKKHVSSEVVSCFKCELCSYKSGDKEEMTSHVLGKHVDPQYCKWAKCEMCLEKFKTDDELKVHIMVTHIL